MTHLGTPNPTVVPMLRTCRLANPWPQLAEYAASFDLDHAEEHLHSHIPYGKPNSLIWEWDLTQAFGLHQPRVWGTAGAPGRPRDERCLGQRSVFGHRTLSLPVTQHCDHIL